MLLVDAMYIEESSSLHFLVYQPDLGVEESNCSLSISEFILFMIESKSFCCKAVRAHSREL